MNKTFPTGKSAVTKLFMTLAMLISGVFLATAQEKVALGNEFQPLELGVTYTVQQYKAASGTFTASTTGTLTVSGNAIKDLAVYSDKSCQAQYMVQKTSLNFTGDLVTIPVEAGNSYYFYSDFPFNGGDMVLYMDGHYEQPLEVQYMQPEDGETLDFNRYPSIAITFNQAVKLTNATAVIKVTHEGQIVLIDSKVTASGLLLTVPLYSVMRNYLADGQIAPGDAVEVIISGVTTESGTAPVDANANGDLVYTYRCGSIPVTVVSQYVPDPFMSYWAPGTPEGMLKFVFADELGQSEKTYCELGWGNAESEGDEYYVERVPVVVEGNTVTVDFTGKLRTPEVMTPQYPTASYSTISIKIGGLVDKYGVPVGSEGQGTIGSYSFAPAYKVVARSTIAADFEPAAGSAIEDAKTVSVWMSGVNAITFDGFLLSGTDANGNAATAVVPMADVKMTPDGSDAAEYEFSLPADVLGWKSLVITLNNVVSQDGYDHSGDVRCSYGGFVITYSEPAAGTEFEVLPAGYTILIENNLAQKYPSLYLEYEIIDADPTVEERVVKTRSWLNRQDDGSYTSEVFRDVKLMYGHDYQITVYAWEDEMTKNYSPANMLGSDFVVIKGLTIPYKNSSTLLTSINPEPETILPIDCESIVLEFDGLVTVSGFINEGNTVTTPFKEVKALDADAAQNAGYSTKWALVFPDGFLAKREMAVEVSFKVMDMDGLVVLGNLGAEENSYFYYTYYAPGQFKEVVVDFGGENPASVSQINVSYELGINYAYNPELPLNSAYVMSKTSGIVASVASYELVEDPADPWATATSLNLILDRPITEAGSYMLIIPANYFNLGTEMAAYNSAAVQQMFTVGGVVATATPEAGVVTSLSTIVVDFGREVVDAEAGNAYRPYLHVAAEDVNVSVAGASVNGSEVTLSLRGEITEEGEYTVVIPEGFLKYADGSVVPEVSFNYTIEGAEVSYNLTVTPAPGVVSELPKELDMFFDDYEEVGLASGKATLSVNGSEPVALPDAGYGTAWNEVTINLDQAYTADGEYVISFPAGYFDLDGTPSKAFSIVYTIGAAPAYAATFTPEPGNVTELPEEISVVYPNEKEVGLGAGKATVSYNGGEAENLPDAYYGIDWNEAIQPLCASKGNGTYAISFPAGYFALGEAGDRYSEAMTITYIVGEGAGVNGIFIDAARYVVYTTAGVLVLDTENRDDLRTLAPGMYIVNGVKLMLK